MATINISKERMIADINSELCGKLEAWTCSLQYSFDDSGIKIFTRCWAHPGLGDYTKITEDGKSLLGIPGNVFTHGYRYSNRPICHPWFQEQDDKYPGFIQMLWQHIHFI